MLERNRGARRDRTRRKKERGYRELRKVVEELSHTEFGGRIVRRVDGTKKDLRYFRPGRLPTPYELKLWSRRYLRQEGRLNWGDNSCGDCSPGSPGPCSYCGVRSHLKERAIAAELREWVKYGEVV